MLTYGPLGRLGRFANALFEIAATIGIAIRSQQSFGFQTFRNYDAVERFGLNEDIDVYKHFVNQLPEIPEGTEFQTHGYFWGYEDLYFPTGNWSLHGQLQSPRYFENCIETVRHYMLMVDEPNDIDAIAVHIRRGDYDPQWHVLQGKDYYREAFGHMPPSKVLLFSDDIKQASDIMDNIGIEYEVVDKDGIESFKIMKRCKHFITANSSYSLMASILGNQEGKRIVCPGNWFGPSWQNPIEMAKDIYPDGAIII
jgi:hypothetical protein